MSENLKTIKELVNEWGITKQTIQYHIKSLPNKQRKKNNEGVIVLDELEQRFIYNKLRKRQDREQAESGQKVGRDKTESYLTYNNIFLKKLSI